MSDLPAFPSLVGPPGSNPQNYNYGNTQPPYAGNGRPNQDMPPQRHPNQNGYLPPQSTGYNQSPDLLRYSMGYAPGAQPQQVGYGNPPQNHMRPHSTGMSSNPPTERPTSANGSEKLRRMFNGVDRNGDGKLNESELRGALINGDYTQFNRDTVVLMMGMFGSRENDSINFAGFENLWRYLTEWRKIFTRFDVDQSDTISLDEFTTALLEFGYKLSPRFTKKMFDQYARLDKTGQPVMSFDMFVQSCINIKRMTAIFSKRDTNRAGYISLGFEDFLDALMEYR